MFRSKYLLVVCLFALGFLSIVQARADEDDHQGAVFVMTNAATGNHVKAYVRHEDGSLEAAGTFSTGGNGSGGTTDPLQSQGSLSLSADHRLLFAVNAGSGTVSSFAVHGTQLRLIDQVASGGSSPNALAVSHELLYVLNAGGNGNVSGFRITPEGRLIRIENSTANLSGTATSPTSLAFSPNGRFLTVTESATNNIDVFRVFLNGRLSDITVNPSSGATPFAALFAPNGALIVANASNSVSSYALNWNGTLSSISSELPSLGAATCWDVITPEGGDVYTANAGTSNLSGFTISRRGVLTAIGSTIVGANPSGSTNLDTAISADGRYIYTVNSGTGAIGEFAVESDGELHSLGQETGLPANTGFNGIAAY